VIRGGVFDRPALTAAWQPAEASAKLLNYEQAMEAIRNLGDYYRNTFREWTEKDFRAPVDVFGRQSTRGSMIVSLVVNGHAAYRTQLFCYLKACGRDELNTMNLWGGVDSPMPA
jgi:hypothetical protein